MLDDKQRAMLDEFGIFVLPNVIEHEIYEDMVEVIHRHTEHIELYCRGNGGDSRSALAIVDLIKMHGNVRGVLLGEAVSSHAIIWAACQRRVIGELGAIGVHQVAIQIDTVIDASYAKLMNVELVRVNDSFATILAASGLRDFYFWKSKLENVRSDGAIYFDATQLVEMGIASRFEWRKVGEADMPPVAKTKVTDLG